LTLIDRAIVKVLPAVPRPVVRKLSERYIAGAELADACRVVKALNAKGKMATLDVLGEEVHNQEEARAAVDAYRNVFDTIREERLDSNVSVKLTGLGLKLDEGLCFENVSDIVRCAEERNNFVRIDMEDSSTTTETLVVLQAYMKRTLADIADLADLRPSVRVCKGIYIEPPEIAYQDFDTVRMNFNEAVTKLLDVGGYVAVASHDEWVIAEAVRIFAERELAPEQYEFQMLLGVRADLGDELVREGHRLRIYVPFGRQWYEYSLRRLQESPKIAGYIAADTFKRMRPGRNSS
jgi:proline dehydrogenase